jgi:hypothetical protein
MTTALDSEMGRGAVRRIDFRRSKSSFELQSSSYRDCSGRINILINQWKEEYGTISVQYTERTSPLRLRRQPSLNVKKVIMELEHIPKIRSQDTQDALHRLFDLVEKKCSAVERTKLEALVFRSCIIQEIDALELKLMTSNREEDLILIPPSAWKEKHFEFLLLDRTTKQLKDGITCISHALIRQWAPLEKPDSLLREDSALRYLLKVWVCNSWSWSEQEIETLEDAFSKVRTLTHRCKSILRFVNSLLPDSDGTAILSFLMFGMLFSQIKDTLRRRNLYSEFRNASITGNLYYITALRVITKHLC